MNIEDFDGTLPEFLPEDFLTGQLEGWGLVERLTGGVQKRFVVQALGTWDAVAKCISFVETWRFDYGATDTLVWRINKLAGRRYSGTEGRLKGEAEGQQAGCAFNWRYTRDTPLGDGKSMTLNFDDWFFSIDPNVVIVRGTAGRIGIPFSIVHVTYRKCGGGKTTGA